jgi:hypothetical protein
VPGAQALPERVGEADAVHVEVGDRSVRREPGEVVRVVGEERVDLLPGGVARAELRLERERPDVLGAPGEDPVDRLERVPADGLEVLVDLALDQCGGRDHAGQASGAREQRGHECDEGESGAGGQVILRYQMIRNVSPDLGLILHIADRAVPLLRRPARGGGALRGGPRGEAGLTPR